MANRLPKISGQVMFASYSPSRTRPLSVQASKPDSADQPQLIYRKRPKKKARAVPHHSPSAKPVNVSIHPEGYDAKVEPSVLPAPPIHIEHSHESNTVDPILLVAWQAYHKGDLDMASLHYSEVLNNDAQNHNSPSRDALLGMAAIAQQRAQDQIAAKIYNQLLALNPRDPDAHAGISSLLGEKGSASTESRLKFLLAQYPEAAALHFALGNHYAEQSRWGKAEQAYFIACELESDNVQFVFNLAVSLDHLGQNKLAVKHYRQAMQMDNVVNTGFDHVQTQSRLDELTNH